MPQAGYVYILHGVGTSYIKVGKTTNVMGRLRALSQHLPFRLQILSVELVFDMDQRERELLQTYANYQSMGEWFMLPPEMLRQWPMDAKVAPFTYLKEVPRLQQELEPRERARRLGEAKEWLADFLATGEMASLDVIAAAAGVEINQKTLRRAKAKLPIEVIKRGSTWYWRLIPSQAVEPQETL